MTRKRIYSLFGLLALLIFTVLSSTHHAAAQTPSPRCIGFEDLPLGAEYHVGVTLTIALFEFHVRPFIAADGSTLTGGYAKVTNGLLAGGSGKELQINNVNLALTISPTLPIDGIKLRFGEYGGNLNLQINGDFRNFANFADINGAVIGGANVAVTGGNGNDTGTLEVAGAMTSFAVGGQELFIDDLCPLRHPPEAGPDLGDAPDSTNHVGIANTAYPASGINGRFPTVWQDPTGAPSGPKHLNQRMEAWLGDHLSREQEADAGPDQDTINNILNGGADNADNDRADDGWLNRNVPFVDCQPTTLRVRVSKSVAATTQNMFLNVWFDGNRDGDWEDAGQCNANDTTMPSARSFEWIVQNFAVNVAAIPAGGFVDIVINTRLVMNATPGEPHWMRFTLGEQPIPMPASGALPDGRGPQHPNAYLLGETEDYLQRPAPQGQPGVLVIDKSVEAPQDPVKPGDTLNYTIRLEHQGGTAPAHTELLDVLPRLIRLAGPVQVIEEVPSVNPLQARFDRHTVGWRGELSPGARLNLTFPVQVRRCYGGQIREIKNIAHAQQTDGTRISDDAVVMVQCLRVGPNDIQIMHIVLPMDGEDPIDPELVPGVPVRVRTIITNNGQDAASLGFTYQKIEWTFIDGALAANDGPAAPHPQPGQVFTLAPGESYTVERTVNFAEFPGAEEAMDNLDQELEAIIDAVICLIEDEEAGGCPDQNTDPEAPFVPHNPLRLRMRFDDVGDAPDSTNHFAAPMTAYPGVPANFPTVFDPATGLPQGPRHDHPRHFHLGRFVSPETGVDVGIDADGVHNLIPPLDQANLDGHDDGIRPATLRFEDCRRTVIEVAVFISPRAANYFREHNRPGFLNIWLDSNRDGDWADFKECPPLENLPPVAIEHIVIDYPVDAAALGPGLHILSVPTDRVPWPAEANDKPAWLRLTLSEEPSVKSLNAAGIPYGDGRGPDHRLKLGETEDYILRSPPQPSNNADVAIQKHGRVQQEFDLEAGNVRSKIAWLIEYGNRGDATAQNVVIRDLLDDDENVNEVLLGVRTIPEIPYAVEDNHLIFRPGEVAAGEGGKIFIVVPARLDIATTAVITNVAVISATNDVNPENNKAIARVAVGLRAPHIITPVDGTTCSETVEVHGRAEPGAAVDLYVDDALKTTLTADGEGRWSHTLTLAEGTHTLYAVARLGDYTSEPSSIATLIVDPNLAYDPISLKFTDDHGHSRRPRDEHGRTDAEGWGLRLRPNATYTVSVRICCEDPNGSVSLTIEGIGTVELSDPDGDHIFTGTFSTGPRDPTPGEMSITITCGDNEVTASGNVVLVDPEGVVYDLTSGQVLADSTVACMEAQTVGAGGTATGAFSLWNAGDYGQVNPQSTAADGYFSFMTPAGLYQLAVAKPGYQSYRSPDINVMDEPVRYDVPLTPIIAEAAGHLIQVSEAGFSPAVLTVEPGAVIEWMNVGVDNHTSTSVDPAVALPAALNTGWDSGLLAAGESYKFQLNVAGTYTYQDAQNPANTATIIVQQGSDTTQTQQVFLPVIER